MALPSSGQLSFLMIRNDIKAFLQDGWPFVNNQVGLVGSRFGSELVDGKVPAYYNASDWYLDRMTGTTSVSELRGKSPSNIQVKYTQTYMVGYWEDDILVPEGSNMELVIAEEDYQELYDDGLVDMPPVEFFARLNSKPEEAIESKKSVGPVIGGYKINSVVERTVDYHTTEGMFEITVAGHDVPQDWLIKVDFINAETGEVFESLTPKRPGERVTAASGKEYTFWSWSCTRGQMFPKDVEVTVMLETKSEAGDSETMEI